MRLESALALAPQDPGVVLAAAEGYAILGDTAEAKRQLRKTLDLGTSWEYAKRVPELKEIAQERSVQSPK